MITIMYPCERNSVWLSCDWNCHLRRPGYKQQYAGTDYAGAEQPLTPSQYNGKTLQAMWSNLGYGYTTFVEHYDQNGNAVLRIRNAHQKNLNVKVGDIVNPGDVLGTMDSTGNSTGTHTHWEVWIKINGQWRNIDPLNPVYGVVIVGDQSALQPLDGSEPPPLPEIEFKEAILPRVKNVINDRIRIRSKPEVSAGAMVLSYISPNEEWDYCGEAKDRSGNTWYAIKKGDKIGWAAAIYKNRKWITPIDDLSTLEPTKAKNIMQFPINIRSYPFVSPAARIVGVLHPNKEVECFGYKTDTIGNIWFSIKNNNDIGWCAAKYNGNQWIAMVEE